MKIKFLVTVPVSVQNLAVVYHTDHISNRILISMLQPHWPLFLKLVMLTIVVPSALTNLPSSVLVAGFPLLSFLHFSELAVITQSKLSLPLPISVALFYYPVSFLYNMSI